CALATFVLSHAITLRAAEVVWTNVAGGNWNVSANWSPNQVPLASDNAYITNAGTYGVVLNVNANLNHIVVGGASGVQTLSNGSPTLTLGANSIVETNGTLTLTGGVLT